MESGKVFIKALEIDYSNSPELDEIRLAEFKQKVFKGLIQEGIITIKGEREGNSFKMKAEIKYIKIEGVIYLD